MNLSFSKLSSIFSISLIYTFRIKSPIESRLETELISIVIIFSGDY